MSERSDTARFVSEVCDRNGGLAHALLPILQEIQAQFGYVCEEAVAEVATQLNLSRAEVHGVVSFYADLRTQPPTRHVIRVCRAEACQASGGRAVWDAAVAAASTRQGMIEVEAVYCLGNCACAPSVMTEERVMGRVNPQIIQTVFDVFDKEVRA